MRLQATRILLVEDADDVREALETLLRAEGAEVVPTATGREALACVVRANFEVLLTDIGLPDIRGDILIREVLALTSRRPRVIAMTGYGEPYQSQAREAGADAVLTKPLEWNDLVRELEPGRDSLAA